MYRTHDCSKLRAGDVGASATLSGWVDSRRDHGGVVFIDLRDREGITQIVFHPTGDANVFAEAQKLRSEDVVSVTGSVVARSEGTVNPKISTGEIELVVKSLTVLNRAEVPPFP